MSKTLAACVVGVGIVAAGLGPLDVHAGPQGAPPAGELLPAPAVSPQTQTPVSSGASSGESVRPVLNRYCVGCHNERLRTAGLALDTMDAARVGDHPDAWEKVVRKLRTGAMPPVGRRRPDAATYATVASALENGPRPRCRGRLPIRAAPPSTD